MKILILALIAALGVPASAGAPQPPVTSSCRVTPRPVGFPGGLTETRTLQPYTGTAPLTHVLIDACIASFARCAAENRTLFPFGENLQVQWQHADMRFRVWIDGTTPTLLFDETLTHPTIGFVFPSYDGATDFAGPSGTMHENFKQALVTIEADVTPEQAKLFSQPFNLLIEMTSPDGVTSFHEGVMTSQIDQLGSAGVTFRWNEFGPVSP
jgi:hypothetical protein